MVVMVKLPGIDYGGVPSLGRQGTGGARAVFASQQAEARSKIQQSLETQRAVNQVAGQVVELAKWNKEKNARHQVQTANVELSAAKSGFRKRNDGRDYYKADEVPDGVDVRKTEMQVQPDGTSIQVTRDKIPAHEVRAEMFKNFTKSSLDAAAEKIEDPEIRSAWLAKHQINSDKEYGKRIVAGIRAGHNLRNKETREQVADLIDSQKHKEASMLITNSDLPQWEQNNLHSTNNRLKETNAYSQAVNTSNVSRLRTHIHGLVTGGNTTLTPQEQTTWINAMQGALNKQEKLGKRAEKENQELTASDGWKLYSENKLNMDWFMNNVPNMSSSDVKAFAAIIRDPNKQKITDPEIYSGLDEMAEQKDPRTLEGARSAYAAGMIQRSDYDRIRDVFRADWPAGSWQKEGKEFIKNRMKSDPFKSDIKKDVRFASAIAGFQDYINRKPNATREEGLDESRMIVREWEINWASAQKHALPNPRFAVGQRAKYNIEDSRKATAIHFLKKYNGNILESERDPEYLRQLRVLDEWEEVQKDIK